MWNITFYLAPFMVSLIMLLGILVILGLILTGYYYALNWVFKQTTKAVKSSKHLKESHHESHN